MIELKNVKFYQIKARLIFYPSYSICLSYRDNYSNLIGESFLIFVDNKKNANVLGQRILFKYDPDPNLPIKVDEEELIDMAVEISKGDHLKKFYEQPLLEKEPAWPSRQKFIELSINQLISIYIRDPSIQRCVATIQKDTGYKELKNFLEKLTSLPLEIKTIEHDIL